MTAALPEGEGLHLLGDTGRGAGRGSRDGVGTTWSADRGSFGVGGDGVVSGRAPNRGTTHVVWIESDGASQSVRGLGLQGSTMPCSRTPSMFGSGRGARRNVA